MNKFAGLQRLVRTLGLCLAYVGFAGLMGLFALSNFEVSKLPRIADQSAGRVCPRGIHGIVVYETQHERRLYDLIELGSFAILGASLLLLLIYRWKYGPEPKSRPPASWKPPK